MKKIISFVLSLAMITALCSPAFAVESPVSSPISSGALVATPEEIAEAEAAFDPNKFDYLNTAPAPMTGWYAIGVPYYGQETNTSCGPASARMMLKYLTGKTYSESTIRSNMSGWSSSSGVTLANLLKYVHGEQDEYSYTKYYGSSMSYIFDGFIAAIRYSKAAPVCGVKEQTSAGFPYNLSGHFIVITAVASDSSAVTVMDPWAGYKGDSEYEVYDLSASNLMTGYAATLIGVAF